MLADRFCKVFVPPAVALILVGAWVGPQRISMAALKTDCGRMRSAIAAAESTPNQPARDPLEARRKAIEWRNIAACFPSNPMTSSLSFSGALPDPRVAMRFRQRMEAMSAVEIIAMLDEIAALDLPGEARENLEWTLLDSMARKDPAAALAVVKNRGVIESTRYRNLISGALQAWSQKDPDAAGAWFDRQIAAGAFASKALNGVSDSRQMFESALISTLLGSSPQAAAVRLAALPENQRGDVMHMYALSTVPEANQVAHAELIRSHVPTMDQAAIIASQASFLFKPGDYSAVSAYLERIHATPSERKACAIEATRNMIPKIPNSNHLTRDDIDGLREWVSSQAPDMTETITGKALGEAAQGNRNMEFSAAAGLAVEYSTASGSDEVLVVFLTSQAARSNQAAARVLAGKISDDARRAKILDFLN